MSDASLTIAEQYDPGKTYNIYTLNELKKYFPMWIFKGLLMRPV